MRLVEKCVSEMHSEEEFQIDPHLFVLHALIPLTFVSLYAEGEYR